MTEIENQNGNQNENAPAVGGQNTASGEQPAQAPAKQTEPQPAAENDSSAELKQLQELKDKLSVMETELVREQIKVKLLLLGILPEKLEDGAAMAFGLCVAGKSPDAAAEEIMSAYPHFKAERREVPQFSAESAGSTDGFNAIRKIFSTSR